MIGALVAGITGSGGGSLSSYESIATATGTGSSGTITFSSIPSGFKHLQIRVSANTGTAPAVTIRFNSDTGTNYTNHAIYGDGATAGALGTASTSSTTVANLTASYYGVAIIDLLDPFSTSKYKTIRSFLGYDANGSGAVYIRSGVWMSTSAVTRIDIAASDNFTTASTFALYGIKEA